MLLLSLSFDVIIDALRCKEHFIVLAGECGANLLYFLLIHFIYC